MSALHTARHLSSLQAAPYKPPAVGGGSTCRRAFSRAGRWLAATFGGGIAWALEALHTIAPITTAVGR